MIAGVEIKKWVMWPWPRPFRFVIQKLGFDIIYLYAKFDDSSFSRSRDMIGGSKFKVGHVTLTMPL